MKHVCYLLLSTLAAAGALPASAQHSGSLTGNWSGTLGPLALTAHLTDQNGTRTGTLDVPAQNAKDLPLEVVVQADSVYLRMPVARAVFASRRSADGQTLTGEWRQNGRTAPLSLARVAPGAIAGPRRPQQPQAPFPYKVEEVTFRNAQAQVQLAGTYTVPAGKGPFPAVALLTGSGPEDRNSTLFGHQPFAVLADYLTRRGVAVLRFDDRGVGQSGGTLAGTTSLDYAADARAALAWLRARPEVKKNKVGLVGHSQGGTSAIEAAGQPLGPNMLVLLAAPGLPGDELIMQQALALARLQQVDSVQLRYIERAQRQVIDIVEQNPDNTQARTKLLPLLNQGGATDPATLARLDAQINQATSPSYRHLLADRPATTLPKVHCPVLALGGSKDAQVPAAANLAALKKGLQAGGNRDVTTQVMPGLNHLFQTAPTGSPSEYGTIEETFAPATLQLIGDWLLAHNR
jgi:pimeloyl-ACP methyl ester carboxylesterase